MTDPTNGNVPELAGSQDAKSKANFIANSAAIIGETQPIKPDIDLLSWAELGGFGKPSRAERKAKKSWIRGAI